MGKPLCNIQHLRDFSLQIAKFQQKKNSSTFSETYKYSTFSCLLYTKNILFYLFYSKVF